MQTLVLPLGTVPTKQGSAYALLAELPNGLISLVLGDSWADAAKRLAPELTGPVNCDEALATVGRRLGWKVVTPTLEQSLERAAIAVGIAADLPKENLVLRTFVSAWVDFYRLELWTQMPAEMSLTAVERSGKKEALRSLAVMGQAGLEYGLAYYEDKRAFDAIWSGEHFPMTGISVLADQDPHLRPSFQPFGVPPPVVTRIVKQRAHQPGSADFIKATAALQLLTNVLRGELGALPFGPGATLELLRDEPKAQPRKRAPKKK